jgi:hypothetical protein
LPVIGDNVRMDVAAVILPLVGVALGTVGTLTGQFLATRGEARRHAVERAAATRAEVKQAIVEYLDAVQSVEQLIDTGDSTRPVDDLLHTMWLKKKVLELVCEPSLGHTAHRYTSTLHQLASGKPSSERKQHRVAFMTGAREALGA